MTISTRNHLTLLILSINKSTWCTLSSSLLSSCLNLADFKMSCQKFAIRVKLWSSTMLLPACFQYIKYEQWKTCWDGLTNTVIRWLALISSISSAISARSFTESVCLILREFYLDPIFWRYECFFSSIIFVLWGLYSPIGFHLNAFHSIAVLHLPPASLVKFFKFPMEYLTHVVVICSTFTECTLISWLQLNVSLSPFKAFIWWGPLCKTECN